MPEQGKILVAVKDATGYRFECQMGLLDSIGDLRRAISLGAYSGKIFPSDALIFSGKPLDNDDVKIVDQFFAVLSFILRSDTGKDSTLGAGKFPFANTTLIVNTNLTLERDAVKLELKDVAVLFPGQGSQQVGMGKALIESGY